MFARKQPERLRDEVYRQMYRLESHRPGAALDLALALLRAWMDTETAADGAEERQWLRQIGPVCVRMLEAERRQSTSNGL